MIEFENNIGLVYSIYSNNFSGYKTWSDELIQEGLIGLWKACQTYDSDKGTAFSTYATKCIKNQMYMFIRKELNYSSKVISLDRMINSDRSEDTYSDYLSAGNDEETAMIISIAKEVAERLGWSDMLEFKLNGMTQREMVEELGISEVAISERMAILYKSIREELNKDFI